MLTPPDLDKADIAASLHDGYGLQIAGVEFLPLGADFNTAVYRAVTHDDASYFLKLRLGNFDSSALHVPAYLRYKREIEAAIAPLPTQTSELWMRAHGFDWILYPFIEGANGFEQPLSKAQWKKLGSTLAEIHRTELPEELTRGVAREDYSVAWCDQVRHYHGYMADRVGDDWVAGQFKSFWKTNHIEIDTIVDRVEELAQAMADRDSDFVLCHADLHAGNLLLGDTQQLSIVDWDSLILAPKECDLMFIGGGIGGTWNDPDEAALFYCGYGETSVDQLAVSYYRYQRIVVDMVELAEQVLGERASSKDRMEGFEQMASQFAPGNVVEIARRSYLQLV